MEPVETPAPDLWRPLLVGEAAASTMTTLAELATSIVPTADPSLGRGSAGTSLFLAYLARADGRQADARLAASLAEEALTTAIRSPEPSLYGGLIGPAWVVDHLGARIFDAGGTDPLAPIDAALLALLQDSPWVHDFDLIAGLVGMGVYALSRLPRPDALECLELVIEHLGASAEHRDGGLTWLTRPELQPDWQRQETPQGYYDVGLAHGVAGVVSLLGSTCAAGVAHATAARLLEGSVAWLLGQRSPSDGGAVFPAWVALGGATRPGPLHWCYGDPGVAAALLVAARATGRSDWEDEATRIALCAAQRPIDGTRVVDAGICHGSAGLAHMYNRFWQATLEPAFAVASRSWLERIPRLLPETGEAGFLEGRAGVGLVLLAALGLAPEWDAVLALSSPR